MSTFSLSDDGTLDLVVSCKQCGWIGRYNPALEEEVGEEGRADLALELANEDHDCTVVWSVAVYLVDRTFGGPEEGGWYYDYGVPQISSDLPLPQFFTSEEEAYSARQTMQDKVNALNEGRPDISSVLSRGRYEAVVMEGLPKMWPERRPTYE